MRIATYNFLGGGSGRRSTHWELIRERLAPDLLLAQECRPPPPGDWAASLWSRATARGWGTGVFLARGAIERIPVRGFAGWVVGGELDGKAWPGARPLCAFSVHCPAGEHGYVKTMGKILDRLVGIAAGADMVLGGDFNVVAGYRGPDAAVRMSEGERRLLDRISEELALIPSWQAMHPGVPLAQTLRWSGNRQTPYHCDGVFVPRAWRGRLASAEVLSGPEWDALSDHNPVVTCVSREPRRRRAKRQ